MTKLLSGKIALITGASRGIGRAIALELASRGADIMVNFARNEEAALSAKNEVESLGRKASLFQGNVGDPKIIDDLVMATISIFGGVDILVHNAAIGAFKPVHKLKINQWDLSMDVNTKAFYLLAQKALPSMEQRGGGSMMTISSLGARRFIPDYGAIGISKAALETLVRYLAVELASKKIRVNCVSGGLVETDAVKSFPQYESFKNEVVKRTPAGRIGKPEDIAKVVGFLASPESEWIVGQTIVADGGLSLI
ncbi:MAG: glucose 1-dehydrogenase [Candidatus Omnitrophica bacterium]|nr:glucose 1-dehydrogenase [Candidatus Omnitrophota bacterium]